jgi:PAS domain S-box-containing protein
MANPGTSGPKPAGRRTPERDRHDQDQRPAAADMNFWAVFESAPDGYLLLAPDPPRFTMVAANDSRLRVTMTRRENVIGRPLFEVFPDNPTDPGATGVRNLQASLNEVLRTGKPHRMALQKYDIRTPDGEFEERYWDPLNWPVFDDRGNLIYIIHRVEDVTDQVRSQRRARENESILARLRESEERYRLLADMIPQHIWTTDATGYHGYFSRRWYDFTGATLAETEGERWLRFLHPDDRERTLARWRHSLRTGEPYSIEYRFRGADGEYRWFLGQAMPLRDEAGKIVEWFGTLTDISERKRAEENLRESERNFRALANSIPQLAWMADSTGWIFWYNERWHEYTGTTLEEMQGWGWQKVHHPEHVERVVERIRRAFEAGERWEDTLPLRSKTGAYRWFLSRALPIKDEAGNVMRWFGTNTDITEQIEAAAERERLLDREREARAEAERRREELERVTESRTRLMRGFTHDVKNPLGAADGYAQLLEDGILGELSAKQVESVQRIRRSIQTSLHLIHDLLELARAEAGQIELELVPTDIAELVRETAEDFRAQAAAAGLGLEVRTAEGLPTRTDPARVRQILSNLLSNAVKYTPEGGITVEAGLRTDGSGPRGGEWIAIGATDTGPGIPAGKRELIFQEFTRLDPEAQHGAGVGLAISRRIARLLGGDITVESEVGRGSTFTLWLPLAASN